MAELVSKNRLQPALLDRLTDTEPAAASESRERRVISLRQLREGVLRDIGYLLNAKRLHRVDLDIDPDIAASVLDVGLADFTGKVSSNVDKDAFADEIASTLRRFEPRIIPDTLRVTPQAVTEGARGNTLAFLIEGDLWAQPYPECLYLRTELDLEDGRIVVSARNQERQS